MDSNIYKILTDINCSIVKFRSIYANWAKDKGINYHELLVLYTLRDNPLCTQKEICESYFLPKQTINNIVADLKKKGYINLKSDERNKRLKLFELTSEGKIYADRYMKELTYCEENSIKMFGEKRLKQITDMLNEYCGILNMNLYEKEVSHNEE